MLNFSTVFLTGINSQNLYNEDTNVSFLGELCCSLAASLVTVIHTARQNALRHTENKYLRKIKEITTQNM